jgi:predicted enzyme related to lactoylglutathione lyase
MAELRWTTAFLDLPAADLDAATAFWRAVTGSGLSSARGERDEFATFVPRDGDPYLKVQRIADGPAGIHLDLHTDDVPGFVEQALALGARVTQPGEHVVMASPGGFPFCVVPHPAGRSIPSPVPWWGGTSIVDQVCLDIPGRHLAEETTFWVRLTGWEHTQGRFAEFTNLERPDGQPLRLLLQRLDTDEGSVRAHFDLSSADRVAEVVRHRSLDAELVNETGNWTVLRDPAGLEYCVTDRDPATGVLPPVR